MTVSVIIPNYNHAAYLPQRIESVLNQTHQNFEIIILDDCSTDNSREVIERYRHHPQVSHIIFNEVNSGAVFKQWRKGVELAKGRYVWIAESDDFAQPELLESLVKSLDEHTDLGIAYCDSRIVFSDGTFVQQTFAELRKGLLKSSKWEQDYINNGRKEIVENLINMCTINNASSALFRKSALLSINPFDLELRYIGDWYIYIKMCMKYDICYINKPLNNYREHAANSSKKSRVGLTFVREYFFLFDWLYRHIDFIHKSKIIEPFLSHTRHSLIRNWSMDRIWLYKDLYQRNKVLFRALIQHNIIAPFKSRSQV